jgi:GT2 family glycosyltransferase
MDSVTVLCPIGESVPPLTFQSALSMVGYASKHGVDIQYVGVTKRTLIETARNMLTREFLKTPSEWAFWMDSDMTFPKETIVKLLQVAKDKNAKMVTGIYFQRGGNNWPVCWMREPELEDGRNIKHENQDKYEKNEALGAYAIPGPEAKEPFPVSTAGFGCVLVHRSVFETLEEPWFLFVPHKCSEDFYFFVNAREKGFTLWADPSLHLGHIAEPKVVFKEDCYKNLEQSSVQLAAVKDSWTKKAE